MSPAAGQGVADPADAGPLPDADELILAAEAAEAEAEAAEARAEAARARARAARLRRKAGAADSEAVPEKRAPEQRAPGDPAPAPERTTLPRDAGAGDPTADSTTATSGRAATEGAGSAPEHATSVAGDGAEPGTPAPKRTFSVDDEGARAEPAVRATGVDTPTADDDPDPAGATWRRTARARSAGVRLRNRLARHPRRTMLRGAAVAIIVAAVAISGHSVRQHREAVTQERRAAEFAAAARQGVIALTTLDFARAQEDVQRVLDNSTGAFREDFAGRAEDFTSVIQQSQVATEGTVNAVAVESMTEDSAVVLVAATSKVTNAGGAQQEPRAWRLSVTITREGDALRMSAVEFVP